MRRFMTLAALIVLAASAPGEGRAALLLTVTSGGDTAEFYTPNNFLAYVSGVNVGSYFLSDVSAEVNVFNVPRSTTQRLNLIFSANGSGPPPTDLVAVAKYVQNAPTLDALTGTEFRNQTALLSAADRQLADSLPLLSLPTPTRLPVSLTSTVGAPGGGSNGPATASLNSIVNGVPLASVTATSGINNGLNSATTPAILASTFTLVQMLTVGNVSPGSGRQGAAGTTTASSPAPVATPEPSTVLVVTSAVPFLLGYFLRKKGKRGIPGCL